MWASVAEIPLLAMETLELGREVAACSLREQEVALLNQACQAVADIRFQFTGNDARTAAGTFDHLWIVSVLNDPERFPEFSALSSAGPIPRCSIGLIRAGARGSICAR